MTYHSTEWRCWHSVHPTDPCTKQNRLRFDSFAVQTPPERNDGVTGLRENFHTDVGYGSDKRNFYIALRWISWVQLAPFLCPLSVSQIFRRTLISSSRLCSTGVTIGSRTALISAAVIDASSSSCLRITTDSKRGLHNLSGQMRRSCSAGNSAIVSSCKSRDWGIDVLSAYRTLWRSTPTSCWKVASQHRDCRAASGSGLLQWDHRSC